MRTITFPYTICFFTSLSGLRDIFVYLAKHKLVDVLVTSAGGVEEDFIKCLAPTYLGAFNLQVCDLRYICVFR